MSGNKAKHNWAFALKIVLGCLAVIALAAVVVLSMGAAGVALGVAGAALAAVGAASVVPTATATVGAAAGSIAGAGVVAAASIAGVVAAHKYQKGEWDSQKSAFAQVAHGNSDMMHSSDGAKAAHPTGGSNLRELHAAAVVAKIEDEFGKLSTAEPAKKAFYDAFKEIAIKNVNEPGKITKTLSQECDKNPKFKADYEKIRDAVQACGLKDVSIEKIDPKPPASPKKKSSAK